MTLNVGYKPNVFQGNGIIKEFAYDFNPISIQYLKVYFEEEGKWVEQTSGWSATIYSLSNYDLENMNIETLPESERFSSYGGLVTFDEPPTTRIQIARVITEEQPTSFRTSSGFDAKVVETSLDKLTGMVQQLQEASNRSVKVEVGDNQTPEELLEEVYEKLDSATEIAEDAIEAANQAQIAADNATQAVESAEETLREVTAYVDSAKIEINNTKETAIEEVDTKVTNAKADINSTVVTAQADITFTKDTAISAVEGAVVDLGTTVTQAKADITNTATQAKSDVNNTVEQGKSDIRGYIAESETEIRQIAREEAQEVIDAGKGEIEDYTREVIKPELDSLVTSASESAVLASQKALESSNSATSASLSSTQAHNSAVTAEEWARYAEGKANPNWGYIGGDIELQADLMSKFDTIDDKIKEIELFKFPNATIIGEPTIQNGQVSNFSTVSYLQFPFILDLHEKAFQIDMCFTTATNVQTQQNILDSNFGLALAIQNGKGVMAISSNGTSWDIGSTTGGINIQSNTTYYARLIWNRLQYKTQISTDGVNYVDDMVIVDTRRPYPRTMFIGGCDQLETGHTGHPFLGTINMNKCSLSVMGNVIWQGMDDAGLSTRADISLSNLDELGEARFTAKADDSNTVHKTGEEYIAGMKHFTDAILVEDTNKFLGSGIANNGSIVLQSSKTDGGFIQFLVQNYPDEESKLYNNGHLCIDKAPNETTTTSTQIDTVGARNTKIDSMRTNCITEIPQDIKLELDNGTLTLKAGSKVYVPNGVGKFDVYTTTSDKQFTFTSSSTSSNRLLFINVTNNSFTHSNNCVSGSSDTGSGTYRFWYDTTNNLVKKVERTEGEYINATISFPICVFTSDSTGITSIDQVFNGFGYIGSTVFALPGVKGLIPNGRNDDGSLKNIEFTTSSVLTYTNPSNVSYSGSFIITNDLSLQASDQTYWKYNQQENLFKHELSFYSICEFSFFECNLGRITSFTPKTTFHALDYNDKSTISGWGMPSNRYIDLTLGASGSTYTAPANGYFNLFIGELTRAGYAFGLNINTKYRFETRSTINGTAVSSIIPARKGDVVQFNYDALGTNLFRFIYAEGEN